MKTRLLMAALSACLLANFAHAQTAPAGGPHPCRPPPTTLPQDRSQRSPKARPARTEPDRPTRDTGEGWIQARPIIFGPGIGGSMDSMMNLLQRIASHGFVIIGRRLDGGPRNAENNRRMIAGLDWLIEQNSAAGSIFANKLDVGRAASMGYSVGGTGAVDIGGHKAITTVVSIHGHSAEADLHGTLLLLGGTADVMRDGRSWLAPTYERHGYRPSSAS